MNIVFGLMMLLSLAPFGFLSGNDDVVAPEYYATGTLGVKKCTEVLKLLSKLRALGADQECNQEEYLSIKRALKQHGIDVAVVEAMFKIDALVIKTEDHGIFLVEKKYDATLQDYYIKGNKVLVLPVKAGEISDMFVDLKYCYEQETILKREQDKLAELTKQCQILERISKALEDQLTGYSA
ncbi:hypothetical protein JST56_00740 [Candidatus Dependentiae bacterium]|nr:hypothetical protein [Candidatus Dependentiae bacterium]